MAECTRSSQKSTTSNGSVSSMSSILKILLAAFSMMKPPADILPPPLVMIGSKLRPGLSARDIAARVISRFSESDAISGEIFQEGNNVMTALVVIMMEEIVNAIQTEMKITNVMDPGAMVINASGANGGGPITVVGTNILPTSSTGIPQ
tara:strand:+ start:4139 stop:4585 length:447 start_codon:yes stop_codon:yes gene_type:complete